MFQALVARPVAFPANMAARLIFVVNNHDHPDTNLTIVSKERCAVDPAIPSLVTAEAGPPLDASCNTATRHHGVEDAVTLFPGVTNAGDER